MMCDIHIKHPLPFIIIAVIIVSCINIYAVGYWFCIPMDNVYLANSNISKISEFQQNNKSLKIVFHNQFKEDCYSNDTKFFFHDIHNHDRDIGPLMEAYLSPVFWKVILLNRTHLIVSKWDWVKNYKYCNQTNALECYTLSLSKCNYNEKIFWCQAWCHD